MGFKPTTATLAGQSRLRTRVGSGAPGGPSCAAWREIDRGMELGSWRLSYLGPPVVPLCPFSEEGSPTKIDYRKNGTLILGSLLEDLDNYGGWVRHPIRTTK